MTAEPSSRASDRSCLVRHTPSRRCRLHLLDLDNLHLTPRPQMLRVTEVYDLYRDIGVKSGDLAYAACNHDPTGTDREQARRSFHLVDCWSGQARVRLSHGSDGADKALIDDAGGLLSIGNLGARVGDAVIGSGDHIFGSVIGRLRDEGLIVHLAISDPVALSGVLAETANGCIWLLPERRCLRHGKQGS